MADPVRHQPNQESSSNPLRVRWERRDVGFWPVAVFVVVSLVAGAAHLVLNWYFFQTERPYASADELEAIAKRERLPEKPQLEQLKRTATVDTDRGDLMLPDLARLNGFGETGEEGFVHIPIDAAMELIVERLPVRQSPDEDYRSSGLVTGGESNSGRVFRRQP